MFKALLAASLAMLACCVAAAWAGPVPPAAPAHDAAPARPADPQRSPLHLIDAAPPPAAESLLDTSVVDGFVAASFSGNPAAAPAPAASDAPPLPDPAVQSAVILLPTPLYAALALLALAALARRAALRIG